MYTSKDYWDRENQCYLCYSCIGVVGSIGCCRTILENCKGCKQEKPTCEYCDTRATCLEPVPDEPHLHLCIKKECHDKYKASGFEDEWRK